MQYANKHSLYALSESCQVARAELDKQKEVFVGQFNQTDRNVVTEYQEDSIALVKQVEIDRERFHDEVANPDRTGLGKIAESILNDIERDCRVDVGSYFVLITMNDKSQSEINRVKKHYDPIITRLRDTRLNEMRNQRDKRLLNLSTDKKKLKGLIDDIDNAKKGLKKGTVSVNQARNLIDEGYSIDSLYEQLILDKVEVLKDKKEGHKPDNIKHYNAYRIDRMYSVFNVWADFFGNKLPKEYDMAYWILWALILDIAAFIFSSIAFREK